MDTINCQLSTGIYCCAGSPPIGNAEIGPVVEQQQRGALLNEYGWVLTQAATRL